MNDDTLLYRQVHPRFVQQNRVTSQAFQPNSNDANLLSVYDGDQIEAADAWEHYTVVQQLPSAGVVAVTVSECSGLQLPVVLDGIPYSEHAYIDCSGYGRRARSNKAKRLRSLANRRGWQYVPDDLTSALTI